MRAPFERLAIVNRGEPAMRLIHAVRELDGGRERPIRTIAFYTEPDRRSLFVRQADESYCLGAARPGYLDLEDLEDALRATRADAAWVGWGFVAERPEFADLCERLGIVFVGPPASAMRLLGDKVAAKRLAEEAGVPVAPWSGGAVRAPADAALAAERIGFPLMVKAAAGGGGRGIRVANGPDELPAALAAAQAEARDAVGDDAVLLERLVSRARHVEVQIIADGQGGAWALGVRDCSLQRRHQKVVEESASTVLDAAGEARLRAAAVDLVLRAGYAGAATVEFLVDLDTGEPSFLEVNARLQVEHPVTEAVTGVDLVKLQLHVAAGGRLLGEPPAALGHAVEARLNAEDPALGFAPAPGRIELLRLPTGPGLRVDTGVAEGDVIPAEFDSMIAKVIAWGRDRDEALCRLHRALADTMVVVEGGTTNQGFLLELLDRPEVRAGDVYTTWLDGMALRGEAVPTRHADVALLQAAVLLAEQAEDAERARFYALARRGRPESDPPASRTVELRLGGQAYRPEVRRTGPASFRVAVDGTAVDVVQERLGHHERRLLVDGAGHRTLSSLQGPDVRVEVDGVPHRLARDDGGVVRNISPAVVVAIPVAAGDVVDEGDVVAVVETMKMESSLVAPFRGRVRAVLAAPNVQVPAQAPLVQLEPLDRADAVARGPRLAFAPTRRPEDPRAQLDGLRRLLLGYDVDPGDIAAAVAALGAEPATAAEEDALLAVHADLLALTRRRHDDADEFSGAALRSPQEHLHAFLRSLDLDAEGIPDAYAGRLRRALAHYGITSLDRTPALEEACHRLFLAGERAALARPAVVAILDRRREQAEAGAEAGPGLRDVLDRLAGAAAGRDQVLADLALEVRHRAFEMPVIEAVTGRDFAAAQTVLEALSQDPEGPAAEARIAALVGCPRPLAALLGSKLRGAAPPVRRVVLETMTRRYYRVRSLEPLVPVDLCGREVLATHYDFDGVRRALFVAAVPLGDVAEMTRCVLASVRRLPAGALAVVDLYVTADGPLPAHEELAERLQAALADLDLPPALHRIVVAVADPAGGRTDASVDVCTFRPQPGGGLAEDEVLRGMHPMMAYRLDLWRLSAFALDRLPSPVDVHLFHGVARANPKDERLFALAEVRDLTPVRDDGGRVVALPELERALVQAFEAMRHYQGHRPPSRRLQWNRVLLHIWPEIDLPPEDLARVTRRLAPQALGLGLETTLVRGRLRERPGEPARDRVLRFHAPGGSGLVLEVDDPPEHPLAPLDEGARRIVAARRRGLLHPAEIVKLLTPAPSGDGAAPGQPRGSFEELDLDGDGALVAVDRPPAANDAGIVVGLIRNVTDRHPEGMLRVALLGDPTKALGSLAEPECRRIVAALDLAERLGVPLEWFALSAGARIAMDSGTENMDWVAVVLRRIIEFTQRGHELNVVVCGINVGAQPYWNAEATMLMHTRGILVMTPDSAMVLTGKQALDFSGGVSAADNLGIGGYERVMGPNGQAQCWAPDVAAACRVLLAHYEHTYVAPGERFPRRAATRDPLDRDVRTAPHAAPGSDLQTVGDALTDAGNPGRKKGFEIRAVMRAVCDRDHEPLERWSGMRDAEGVIAWEAHLGGHPVALLGIQSHPLPRHGPLPADGPDRWTAGTLFPKSSKKLARAINAASGRLPVVVLANLAGFDGSPESLREWQLEFGAEIGRAVVNFDGPIVFCVVSRYHGGAFVVFSQALNAQLEASALEGTFASVIGGAPAAAVVFAREVKQAALEDPRIAELDARLAEAEGAERARLRAERDELWPAVHNEHLGAFAARFEAVHCVERAVEVGSVSRILPAAGLRPYLVDAVERGMTRTLTREEEAGHGRTRLVEPIPH